MVKIVIVGRDGTERGITCQENQTILQIAREHDIDIEGLCDGTLSCATCHVIVDSKFFPQLPPIRQDESDMLELAYNLTENSRLGCQIRVTAALDGLRLTLPESY